MNHKPQLKVAVPLKRGEFSDHFGQSTHFAIFECDPQSAQVICRRDVACRDEHACGFAAILQESGVDVVIVGGMGRGALAHLAAANVKVMGGTPGTSVEGVVRQYLGGALVTATARCDHPHSDQHHHDHTKGGACHCH